MGDMQMSVQSMGEDACPNFLQPFLKNIDRSSCNDGNPELIPLLHNPHRKGGPPPYLGVPCRGALLGRVEQEGEKTSSDHYLKDP